MKTDRRTALQMLAAASLAPTPTWAQDNWPSRPVKILVGLAPGGATDIQARLYGQKLNAELGQPFVVENRPGAGEMVSIQAVVRAPADGYTVLACTTQLTINASFGDRPAPYEPLRDLQPVSLVSKAPYLIVVPAASPFKTIKDVFVFARSSRGGLNFGTSGLNSPMHLGGSWISQTIGAPITFVPYKGTGPALTAAIAGEVHMIFANPISALQHVKAGRLRALAVSSLERSRVFPDLPTIAESGVPGFDVTTWHGWLVPKGTPAAVVNKLQGALATMIRKPELADALAAEGAEAVGSTPEQFAQVINSELTRWKKVIKDANLKSE